MRIQVLNLPDESVGGEFINRFALIVDGHPEISDPDERKQVADDWAEFARELGGKGAFVTQARVDVAEDTATAEMVTEIVRQLDELIGRRIDEHAKARRVDLHFRPPGGMRNVEFLQSLADRARRERDR